MDNQLNLFNVQQYGGKKVRGPYNIKPKEIELSPYQILNNLLQQLANYLPSPIFKREEEFLFPYLKLWNSKYTIEPYEYEAHIYNGDDFSIISAELTGTELLSVNDRIHLHQILLDKIKQGLDICEAAEKLQPVIKYIQDRDKPKQGDFYVWLKKHSHLG